MKRVLIIGICGAGKSTYAKSLEALTGLPVIHLDKEFWLPGWQEPDPKSWESKVTSLSMKDRWIIEGNYSKTFPVRMPRADTIIYLDFPTHLALFRIIRRIYKNRGITRPDMGKDCPERWDWSFIKWVWGFNKTHRPLTQAALKVYGQDAVLYHARSPKELLRMTDQLRALNLPDTFEES